MRYPNGSKSVISEGAFAQTVQVLDCPCSDGKRRNVRITGQPTTAWTIPGSVSVNGKTVTGEAVVFSVNCKEGFYFCARTGKNSDLLPEWTDEAKSKVGSIETFDIFWSPEGKKIATVEAESEKEAIRKTPKPYSKYKGEVYAVKKELTKAD